MRVYPKRTNSIYRDVANYIKEYGKVSNIHGVQYLTQNRSRVEKIVWALLLLATLTCCIFMIHQIWQKYKNNPIVINFASRTVSIHEIPFPAVTICPPSNCASYKFNYTDIYYKLQENETVSEEDLQTFYYTYILCRAFGNTDVPPSSEILREDFFSVVDEVKPDPSFICVFNGVSCDDLFVPIMTPEGICYSFNVLNDSEIFRQHIVYHGNFSALSNASDLNADFGYAPDAAFETYPRRTFLSGNQNALIVLFYSFDLNSDPVCSSFEEGYKIFIHNPWELPTSTHYFIVSENQEILAAIQPQMILTSDDVKKFHPDNRNCYLTTERPLQYFRKYTQINCLLECLTNITLQSCGCVYYFMPRENSTSVCGDKKTECFESALDTLKRENMLSKISKQSRCDCKPSCNSLTYNVETSQNNFLSKTFFASQPYLLLQYFVDVQYSRLALYFKHEEFMAMERNELYGISDFVSNFGGLLGLFTGFSLISFIEILYFFTLRVFYNSRLYGYWFGPVQVLK